MEALKVIGGIALALLVIGFWTVVGTGSVLWIFQ